MIPQRLFRRVLFLIGIAVASGSMTRASVRDPSVLACAKNLIRPTVETTHSSPIAVEASLDNCLEVVTAPRTALGSIGADVYHFEYCTPRPSVFGWFYSSGQNECALLAGDLPDLVGLPLSPEAEVGFTIVALNDLVSRHPVTLRSREQILAYVTDVISLTTPFSTKIVLQRAEDIWKTRPPTSRSKRSKRKLFKRLDAEIRVPSVLESVSGITRLAFFTWEDPGGIVTANEMLVWPDGRLSLRSRIIASAVGPYAYDFRVRAVL